MGRKKIENDKDSEMSEELKVSESLLKSIQDAEKSGITETTSYKIDSSKIYETILSVAKQLQSWHEQDIRCYQKALVGTYVQLNGNDRNMILRILHEKGLWLNSHNVIVKLDKKRR
jgi:hypothetical protein